MGTDRQSGLPEHLRQHGNENPNNHCYGLDRYSYQQGQNAKFDFQIFEDQEPALVARGGVPLHMLSGKDRSFMCDRLQVGADTTSRRAEIDFDATPKAIGFDAYNQAVTGGGYEYPK